MKYFFKMMDNTKKEQTVVFIDAGYLSKISQHFGKGKHLKIDLLKFSRYLCIKQGLWCKNVYYYTAPPFQSEKPTKEEAERKAKYDSFISKIKKNPEMIVREGRLQKICGEFTQKGVDTLLTMDLFEVSLTQKIRTIILLACDTDFVPILKKLREEKGIKIILYYYTDRIRKSKFSLSNHIIMSCDNKVLLTEEYFKQNLIEKK